METLRHTGAATGLRRRLTGSPTAIGSPAAAATVSAAAAGQPSVATPPPLPSHEVMPPPRPRVPLRRPPFRRPWFRRRPLRLGGKGLVLRGHRGGGALVALAGRDFYAGSNMPTRAAHRRGRRCSAQRCTPAFRPRRPAHQGRGEAPAPLHPAIVAPPPRSIALPARPAGPAAAIRADRPRRRPAARVSSEFSAADSRVRGGRQPGDLRQRARSHCPVAAGRQATAAPRAHWLAPALARPAPSSSAETPLIQSGAALAIEGLDIQCGPVGPPSFLPHAALRAAAPLRLANCRVIHCGTGPALRLDDPSGLRAAATACSTARRPRPSIVPPAGRARVLARELRISGFSGVAVHQTGPPTDVFARPCATTRWCCARPIRVHAWIPVAREQAKGDGRLLIHIAARPHPLRHRRFAAHRSSPTGIAPRKSSASDASAAASWARVSIPAGDGQPGLTYQCGPGQHQEKVVAWQSRQNLYSGTGALLAMASSQSPQRSAAWAPPPPSSNGTRFGARPSRASPASWTAHSMVERCATRWPPTPAG